jgi:DNA-binding MarR family transcriptional regulator
LIDPQHLQAFTESLHRLGALFMRIASQQSTAHETFSKQELLTLGFLGYNGASRMGDIASYLGVGQSAVTPLVDRLEAHGLVQRHRGTEDRRVWLVELTPTGSDVVTQEDRVYAQVATEMLTPLSPSEREDLISLLERVCATKSI